MKIISAETCSSEMLVFCKCVVCDFIRSEPLFNGPQYNGLRIHRSLFAIDDGCFYCFCYQKQSCTATAMLETRGKGV
jgi:hypothetical protein